MSFRGPQALSDTPEGVPFLSFHTDSSGCMFATLQRGRWVAHTSRILVAAATMRPLKIAHMARSGHVCATQRHGVRVFVKRWTKDKPTAF